MTTEEFSSAFDTLLNSYAEKAQFGETGSRATIVLDEYEKSIWLTTAQDQLIKQYYLREQNSGYDDNALRQFDFSNLMSNATVTTMASGTTFDSRGKLYALPSDVLIIVNEQAQVTDQFSNSKRCVVVPINHLEYDRLMSKSYTQPNKKIVWRLLVNGSSQPYAYVELIPNKYDTISKYYLRYIRRPKPIILTNLTYDNLSINGYSAVTECELNPVVHIDILNLAARMATASFVGNYETEQGMQGINGQNMRATNQNVNHN